MRSASPYSVVPLAAIGTECAGSVFREGEAGSPAGVPPPACVKAEHHELKCALPVAQTRSSECHRICERMGGDMHELAQAEERRVQYSQNGKCASAVPEARPETAGIEDWVHEAFVRMNWIRPR
ncbi:hypothetical protein AXG93_3893s1230 [Marchantia polymorpha subsp. ruderalis]|uniref:Uncharacterized protein n=1 Tax=Marchantia polymorpha subsp. ruderalis TaxID=1480154 RepID=A0A176WAM5_MARPO|nr:hypothetical protein AXG93_3893s1230 [Marchantia polymorpha subsp. ruderalis]